MLYSNEKLNVLKKKQRLYIIALIFSFLLGIIVFIPAVIYLRDDKAIFARLIGIISLTIGVWTSLYILINLTIPGYYYKKHYEKMIEVNSSSIKVKINNISENKIIKKYIEGYEIECIMQDGSKVLLLYDSKIGKPDFKINEIIIFKIVNNSIVEANYESEKN